MQFTVSSLTPGISVLRDDLLPGGTKRRGLALMLAAMPAAHIGYAGTVFGHGALALAHACRNTGKQAHIYLSAADDHPMVIRLRGCGASVHCRPPLPLAQLHALAAGEMGEVAMLPPGFACEPFRTAMAQALGAFDISPYRELWLPVVSGTLAGAMKAAFPAVTLRLVSVVKQTAGDFAAPEKYHHAAKYPPPYPACPYTDAKVWQFASFHTTPRALIWNVAG